MIRVTLQLRRTILVALRQQRFADAAKRHRGRKVPRNARHSFFRLGGERQYVLGRLARAAGHAGERERCAHDAQEVTPANGIRERVGFARKLVLEDVLKFRSTRDFLQALPILAPRGRLELGPNLSEIDRL